MTKKKITTEFRCAKCGHPITEEQNGFCKTHYILHHNEEQQKESKRIKEAKQAIRKFA